jgi:hypothetical protein
MVQEVSIYNIKDKSYITTIQANDAQTPRHVERVSTSNVCMHCFCLDIEVCSTYLG